VRVPAGSRALHSDYYSAIKKPVFSHNEACSHAHRHHILRLAERDSRARHATRCDRTMPARGFFRLFENIDNIRGFDASDFLSAAVNIVSCTLRARPKSSPRRCVKHVTQLVQKNLRQQACKRGLAVDSSANRANRPAVIRSSRTRLLCRTASSDVGGYARRASGDGCDRPEQHATTSTCRVPLRRHRAAFRRRAQMPSLRLSRSFTTCGLALPPEAFIT
jgi:hypothetical protein